MALHQSNKNVRQLLVINLMPARREVKRRKLLASMGRCRRQGAKGRRCEGAEG